MFLTKFSKSMLRMGKGGRGTQAKTISLSVKALEKVGEKGLLGRNRAIKGI